jgi:hypothetical protein
MGLRFQSARKVYIGLITNIVSDSKRRIDRANHGFWNGTCMLAGTFFILNIHG